MDYIRNSQNRKRKTEFFAFLSRLLFGVHRLGFSGKGIGISMFFLSFSLFFPWLSFEQSIRGGIVHYSAFSLYLGGIGYGIIISLFAIAFFLLSHEKKERLRGYVPFRLSDAQAIVFIGAMLFVATTSFITASFAYTRISSQAVSPGFGMKIAFTSLLFLFIATYFFSQTEKSRAATMSYVDKKEQNILDEYRDILHPENENHDKKKEKNMTLPI